MKAIATTAAIALLVLAPQIGGPSGQASDSAQISTGHQYEPSKPQTEKADPNFVVRDVRRAWVSAMRNDIVIVDCESLDDPANHPDCFLMRNGESGAGPVDID